MWQKEWYYYDVPGGYPGVRAPPSQFDLGPFISKTTQIPTHKPYLFLFLMMWLIECYYFDVPRGHPWVKPHPLNFTYDLISQKQFLMDSCLLLTIMYKKAIFSHHITACRAGIEATGDGKPGFVTIPVTSCQTMHYVSTESLWHVKT